MEKLKAVAFLSIAGQQIPVQSIETSLLDIDQDNKGYSNNWTGSMTLHPLDAIEIANAPKMSRRERRERNHKRVKELKHVTRKYGRNFK